MVVSVDTRLLRTLLQYREINSDTWKTQGDYKNSEDFFGMYCVPSLSFSLVISRGRDRVPGVGTEGSLDDLLP
jgi:hypothetical protein